MSTAKVANISNLAGTKTITTDDLIDRSVCRAWVNFNGTGTVAIRASFNVSSITDENTGQWQVNFTNAMSDTNYCCQVTTGNSTDGNNAHGNIRGAKDTTHVHVGSIYPGQYWYDNEYVDVVVFR